MFPEDLSYTVDHEWIRRTGEFEVRVGITSFAQESLGDIVFVSLPPVGTAVTAGESMGEVESTKSVSEFYAPVSGTVAASNDALTARPELVNSDPYGEGWLVAITTTGAAPALLDAAQYEARVAAAGA